MSYLVHSTLHTVCPLQSRTPKLGIANTIGLSNPNEGKPGHWDETHAVPPPSSCPLPHKITNSDFSDAKLVQQLADAWFNTAACETLNERLESTYPAPILPGRKPGCLSYFRQLRALIARATLNSIRDPATYSLRYIEIVCCPRCFCHTFGSGNRDYFFEGSVFV